MDARRRAVAWLKDDPFGAEFAEIVLAREHLSADGVAIGTHPIPYRLDYILETAAGFVTSRLRVTSRGEGWRRTLDLRRCAAGTWSVSVDEEGELDLPSPGGDPLTFADALSDGGPVALTMAWVSVPDLSVRLDEQRYVSGDGVIHYEAKDGSFAADITVDADGIVVDYPGIARRVC